MGDTRERAVEKARLRSGVVALAVALALVAAAASAAWLAPYLAISRLQAAAEAGDAARVGGLVDFATYRASLERLALARVEQAAAGEDRRSDPLQAFGTTMAVVYARAAADRLVESAASPAGIAALLRGEPPADLGDGLGTTATTAGDRSASGSRARVTRYESPSRFVARFGGGDGNAPPLTLVWKRSWTAWRLSEVRIEGC